MFYIFKSGGKTASGVSHKDAQTGCDQYSAIFPSPNGIPHIFLDYLTCCKCLWDSVPQRQQQTNKLCVSRVNPIDPDTAADRVRKPPGNEICTKSLHSIKRQSF